MKRSQKGGTICEEARPQRDPIDHFFGPKGLLSTKVASFEFRRTQLEMANAVAGCMADEIPLIAEAGTGTGKTWAYLIPSFLSGKKVVVSTATKALQDQILDYDIPILKKLVNPRLRVVCLKGRRNYLCRRRFHEFSYQPTFWNREEARFFHRFHKWAVDTTNGDRSEIPWLPDHFQFWLEVTSSSDQCLGQNCPENQDCFLNRLRSEAHRADLIVVNHHLFFADLTLRKKGTGILPEYQAVVFDEAHELPDIIETYFGIYFGSSRILELKLDLQRKLKSESRARGERLSLENLADQLDAIVRQFQQYFGRLHGGSGRFPFSPQKCGKEFLGLLEQLTGALDHTAAVLHGPAQEDPVYESLQLRSLEMSGELASLIEQDDAKYITWYEVAPNMFTLHATPVTVDDVIPKDVFPKTSAVVFTSATLSVNGSFDYFRQSLGLVSECREMLVTSPFKYEEQSLLYIPKHLPSPHERDFCQQLAEDARTILLKSRGRALFLFTSYRNMYEVHRRLTDKLPFTLLLQGEKPKRSLLAQFKEDLNSVLFATSSFWQGVDVPGEALSCLLIDKLPFETPDDPILSSRTERMAKEGKNPFFHYQVPRAIMQLRQGVGRLIRSSQDRGIIAIFDVRLLTKSYGQHFLRALPASRIVHTHDDLESFFSSSVLR